MKASATMRTTRPGDASASMARLGHPPSKQTGYLGRGVKPLPLVQSPGTVAQKPRPVSPRSRASSTPRRSLTNPPTAPPAGKTSDPRQLLQQCLPLHSCMPSKHSSAAYGLGMPAGDLGSSRSLLSDTNHSTPSARLVRRPNGTTAHLLELPSTVPYVLHLPHNGHDVHIVPCFTPAAAAQIRADAEATAKRLGGWAPRAVGCCTNDVLVAQLGATSQQLIYDAFRRVIMPYACRHFPKATLGAESLPKNPECFFLIKYSGDRVKTPPNPRPRACLASSLLEESDTHTSRALARPRLRRAARSSVSIPTTPN